MNVTAFLHQVNVQIKKFIKFQNIGFNFFLDGSYAYRGCMSDVDSPGRQFCLEHFHQCERCPKRGCNVHTLKFEKKLSCIKCNSTVGDDDCNKVDENSKPTECSSTTLGYTNECYIYQMQNQTFRGCLYDAYADGEEELFKSCSNQYSVNCYTCNHNGCNNASVDYEFAKQNEDDQLYEKINYKMLDEENANATKSIHCYECDSSNNPKCARELDDSMITQCKQSTEEEDFSCFHRIEGEILDFILQDIFFGKTFF